MRYDNLKFAQRCCPQEFAQASLDTCLSEISANSKLILSSNQYIKSIIVTHVQFEWRELLCQYYIECKFSWALTI